MLSIRYGDDVPASMIDLLEHHARNTGVSLGALEVIGASLDHVEAFIVAAEDGRGIEFLDRLGLLPPKEKVELARWQAEKIFG